MEAIKLKTYVGSDGIVKLEFASGITNREMEVLVVLQPLESEPLDEMGYPIGYFDETYGSLPDFPDVRRDELPLEVRDEIE